MLGITFDVLSTPRYMHLARHTYRSHATQNPSSPLPHRARYPIEPKIPKSCKEMALLVKGEHCTLIRYMMVVMMMMMMMTLILILEIPCRKSRSKTTQMLSEASRVRNQCPSSPLSPPVGFLSTQSELLGL